MPNPHKSRHSHQNGMSNTGEVGTKWAPAAEKPKTKKST
jgi:hypothetical protein